MCKLWSEHANLMDPVVSPSWPFVIFTVWLWPESEVDQLACYWTLVVLGFSRDLLLWACGELRSLVSFRSLAPVFPVDPVVMEGRQDLLKVFEANDMGNGFISQILLRDVLVKAGCSGLLVEQLFALAGVTGDQPVPYSKLVDWLYPMGPAPGAGMSPVPLKQAPDPAELALQTLVLLVAAASWSLKAGEVRVEEMPSTPEAFLGFTVASAGQNDSALAAELTQKVQALILDSSIELSVLPKSEALQLLSQPKCGDFAKSIDCNSLGLHVVRFGQQTFRTVAVQPVALPSSLKGVPWQIRASKKPGYFELLGPTVSMDAVVPGHFGKLGVPLPMQLGIQECNDAAKAGKQTNMALQAETLQNNTLAELSSRIAAAAAQKSCAVVVAGPSSSGKTTFAARLALHLQARGLEARPLECDMYFKARADPTHPRDAKGELNFEDPGSLRIDKIKQDLEALLDGKAVELPKFCFKTGTIEEKTGNILQLPKQAVLIIEGIFGLHPKFLSAFGNVSLFKVLIGPWSGARLGNLCVMPERKFRLLRRIGRDVRSRGVDAARVMQKFSSVAAGEQLNIFPFAESAWLVLVGIFFIHFPSFSFTGMINKTWLISYVSTSKTHYRTQVQMSSLTPLCIMRFLPCGQWWAKMWRMHRVRMQMCNGEDRSWPTIWVGQHLGRQMSTLWCPRALPANFLEAPFLSRRYFRLRHAPKVLLFHRKQRLSRLRAKRCTTWVWTATQPSGLVSKKDMKQLDSCVFLAACCQNRFFSQDIGEDFRPQETDPTPMWYVECILAMRPCWMIAACHGTAWCPVKVRFASNSCFSSTFRSAWTRNCIDYIQSVQVLCILQRVKEDCTKVWKRDFRGAVYSWFRCWHPVFGSSWFSSTDFSED